MKDKTLLRGKVRTFQYGTAVSLHKDVVQHFKGDWLNFNIKTNREGKMYIELDTWEPKKQEQRTSNVIPTIQPPANIEIDASFDDLPF